MLLSPGLTPEELAILARLRAAADAGRPGRGFTYQRVGHEVWALREGDPPGRELTIPADTFRALARRGLIEIRTGRFVVR